MQYLLDGIPPELAAQTAPPPADAAAQQPAPAAGAGGGGDGAQGGDAQGGAVTEDALAAALGATQAPPAAESEGIQALRQAIPNLDQLMMVVRQNPQMLQPLL